jgi:hypothetical protein
MTTAPSVESETRTLEQRLHDRKDSQKKADVPLGMRKIACLIKNAHITGLVLFLKTN